MPTPDIGLISAPAQTAIRFSLEPAQNALNSLILLTKADHLSGLDEWVTRTLASLSPERRHTHRVVFVGLFYALNPTRSYASFAEYLDELAGLDPAVLRDRVLRAYAGIPPRAEQTGSMILCDPAPTADAATILANRETFLNYLLDRFPADHVEVDIESEAYELLKNPSAMKDLVVSHLRSMWDETLADEWARKKAMLQASVDAFQQDDHGDLTTAEIARRVTGQKPEEWWEKALREADQVVFVPSAHLGPYLGRFKADNVLWMLFGARLPQGAKISVPDLTRSEMLVRLQAVADDTRLRILQLLVEEGELCSQDIIRRLDLSQSAASRHLQQLSATGYLNERRREGAKCYSLNPDRIEDTLQALTHFLRIE